MMLFFYDLLFQPTRQQQQQRARRSIYTSSENEGMYFDLLMMP
jgi:hypothetical protein